MNVTWVERHVSVVLGGQKFVSYFFQNPDDRTY
jgi:hypothetical protein